MEHLTIDEAAELVFDARAEGLFGAAASPLDEFAALEGMLRSEDGWYVGHLPGRAWERTAHDRTDLVAEVCERVLEDPIEPARLAATFIRGGYGDAGGSALDRVLVTCELAAATASL
jgi:hypothetical protein